MTDQEAFTSIVEGLVGQGLKQSLLSIAAYNNDISLGDATTCAYRSNINDGYKCAIGHLIPDEIYDRKMEKLGVYRLKKRFPDVAYHIEGVSTDMLEYLQRLHDNSADPVRMYSSIFDYARKQNLELPDSFLQLNFTPERYDSGASN